MPDLFFISACLLLGAGAGFLGGLLGIGGGVVMVPGLLLLFEWRQLFATEALLVAVGTSLAVIIFTSASAGRAQIRAGRVQWPIIRAWTLWLVLGAWLASAIAVELGDTSLRAFIAVFLLAVALVMLLDWKPAPGRELPGRLGSAALGTAAGTVSGLAGIGGGNVIVPTLVYHNVPVHQATATSSVFGVPLASAAALGYALQGELTLWQWGYIYVPAALALLFASVLTAPLGVRCAHRIRPLALKRLFAGLLTLVAGRMLWGAL